MNKGHHPVRICFAATVPDVLFSFMKNHIRAAAQEMDVTLVCGATQRQELLQSMPAAQVPLHIERKISPWKDAKLLVQLFFLFRRQKFDLVHSIMPKTGMVAMAAAWMARVPCRVHTFTGQVWANKRGFKRMFLKFLDRLIVMFATHIIVDSPSQREFLEKEAVLKAGKAVVFGHGSICGVDTEVFHPNVALRSSVRRELGVTDGQVVLLYLGRLNRDKGILDLAHAFKALVAAGVDAVLVLVGSEEDVPFSQVEEICGDASTRLRRADFTSTPEKYMVAADIFCLPSYREGFGQAVIEAAACGVPAVASRIYGVTDAVEDGSTGLLFPAGDIAALQSSLSRLCVDEVLRKRFGTAAQKRALTLFNSRDVTDSQMIFYRSILARG